MANQEMNAAIRQGFGRAPVEKQQEERQENAEMPDLEAFSLDQVFELNQLIAEDLRRRFEEAVAEESGDE